MISVRAGFPWSEENFLASFIAASIASVPLLQKKIFSAKQNDVSSSAN
jgi:hypothetical protein